MWTSPAVITAPADEPIALDMAKQFVRLDADDTSFDVEIDGFVAGARAQLEATTNTRLVTQVVELGASSFADLELLPIGPVQDVVSIGYLDTAGVAQTLEAGDFELFGALLERGIRPVFGSNWPTASGRAGSIQVRLRVGYGDTGETLPPDLRVALLLAVRGLFDDVPVDLEARLTNHRIWL